MPGEGWARLELTEPFNDFSSRELEAIVFTSENNDNIKKEITKEI